jgi:hypothetical protein
MYIETVLAGSLNINRFKFVLDIHWSDISSTWDKKLSYVTTSCHAFDLYSFFERKDYILIIFFFTCPFSPHYSISNNSFYSTLLAL